MKIFISAGDPSGDIHAASLAKAFKAADSSILITAIGGEKLQQASDRFLYNLVRLGGFGFWQPLKLYFKLKRLLTYISKDIFDNSRPDRVVVVDYYGFNIHLAREAHKRGIPVFYYISPQVWATRPGRVRKIAKYVKKMLLILPFEEVLYRKAGVDAVFVGHPLIDSVPEPSAHAPAVSARPVIGLFPGSRPNVFKRHIGLLMDTASLIKERLDADFRIFCLPSLAEKCKSLPYPAIVENDFSQRRKLDLAITTSGTVSLENALLGIPMVVYYRLSRFNYFIAKMLANVPYITMVNILYGKMVVPELIQSDAVPEKISSRAVAMLSDKASLELHRKALAGLRNMLGQKGASARAAGIIIGG